MRIALALGAALALAGCVDTHSNASTNAGCTDSGASGVSNQPNQFSYGGNACGRSARESYTWSNSATTAKVSWGGASSTGTLSLEVDDQAGRTVYTGTVAGGGATGASTTSAVGVPGSWTVVLTFSSFTGSMGLHVESGS
ncbi:MAG: hypothetical protein ACYDCK_10105 [Thermoplasmatota archaeon]